MKTIQQGTEKLNMLLVVSIMSGQYAFRFQWISSILSGMCPYKAARQLAMLLLIFIGDAYDRQDAAPHRDVDDGFFRDSDDAAGVARAHGKGVEVDLPPA